MSDKILITGAGGMIGGRLAERLVEGGHEVRVSSRDPAPLSQRFADAARTPALGAGPAAWRPLLQGITHVVHCAGFADAAAAGDEAELFAVNAAWPGEIAETVAGNIPGRFVHLSSIRAVAGPHQSGVIDDATTPAPGDAYGRSKLRGEECVRSAFGDQPGFTILRPAPVYGTPLKGSLALLQRLARLPLPLPLANLGYKRSLLSLEVCVDAIVRVLSSEATAGQTYVVSDSTPVSIAAILTALRRGAGRSPLLFPVPETMLSGLCGVMGRGDLWLRTTQELIVDPGGLARAGWTPAADTEGRLARIASGMVHDHVSAPRENKSFARSGRLR